MVSNEKTPLSYNQAQSGVDSISRFAQNVFTKENIEMASRVAREKVTELHAQAQDGDHSLRFLALVGGLLLIAVSGLDFFGKLLTFNIIGALIEFFSVFLGVVVIILEGKSMFLSSELINRIHKYALFLKFLWGRGCLYLIAGCLQLYQTTLLSYIAGAYLCFVGGLYVVVGQRTAYKLKALRKTLYSEQTLRSKFQEADTDGDGGLNMNQFRMLTLSLGLDLTKRETEAAFAHMIKADNQKLSYSEFHTWWTETDSEGQIDENAFVFV